MESRLCGSAGSSGSFCSPEVWRLPIWQNCLQRSFWRNIRTDSRNMMRRRHIWIRRAYLRCWFLRFFWRPWDFCLIRPWTVSLIWHRASCMGRCLRMPSIISAWPVWRAPSYPWRSAYWYILEWYEDTWWGKMKKGEPVIWMSGRAGWIWRIWSTVRYLQKRQQHLPDISAGWQTGCIWCGIFWRERWRCRHFWAGSAITWWIPCLCCFAVPPIKAGQSGMYIWSDLYFPGHLERFWIRSSV